MYQPPCKVVMVGYSIFKNANCKIAFWNSGMSANGLVMQFVIEVLIIRPVYPYIKALFAS